MSLLMLLGAAAAAGGAAPSLVFGANNNNLPVSTYVDSNWVLHTCSTHTVGPAGLKNFRACFSNWAVGNDAEIQGGYDFNLRTGVLVFGTFTAVTFGGGRDTAISKNYGNALSDAIPLTLAAGTTVQFVTRRIAADNGAAGTYSHLAGTAGIPARQDGIINGTNPATDLTTGTGLGRGARVTLLTSTNVSGGVVQNNLTVAAGGTGYGSGLSLVAWYGAAGRNQPGSEYAGLTAASGFGSLTGGSASSVTVTSGGTGHDANRPPLMFLGGGGGFGVAQQASYGPSFLIGEPLDASQGCVLIVGDSIASGYGSSDGTGDLKANYGIYEQAVNNQVATAKLAGPGNSAAGWNANSTNQKAVLTLLRNAGLAMSKVKVVVALGTNDFLANTNTNVVTSTQAQVATIRDYFTGIGAAQVFGTTVLPAATGTYASTAGQTAYNVNHNAGGRVATYNSDMRAGTPSMAGVIDAAIILRDPTDTNKWRVDGVFPLQSSTAVAFTADGIHPSLGTGIPYARNNLDVSPLLPALASPNDLPNLALWLDPTSGVYKDGAGGFNGADGNNLSRTSMTGLPQGNTSRTIMGWLYPATTTATGIAARWGMPDFGNGYYLLQVGNQIGVSLYGASVLDPTTFTASTWYHYAITYDGATHRVYRDGTLVASGSMGTAATTTQTLHVGSEAGNSAVWNGRIDSLCVYDTALSLADIQASYAAGVGQNYADLTTAQKSGLVAFYNLDEASGTRNDSHASNHLTQTGTVDWAPGIVASLCADGDPVTRWVARTGQTLAAPSAATRPTYRTNSGKPYIEFDGVDDRLNSATSVLPQSLVSIVARMTSGAGGSGDFFGNAADSGDRACHFYSGSDTVITRWSTGPTVSTLVAGTPFTYTYTGVGSGATSAERARKDGGAWATVNGQRPNPTAESGILSLAYGPGFPRKCNIANFVLYAAVPNDASLAAVETYVGAR